MKMEEALEEACKVINEKIGDCPYVLYGWEHEGGCDSVCDVDMWIDAYICWKEHFLDGVKDELVTRKNSSFEYNMTKEQDIFLHHLYRTHLHKMKNGKPEPPPSKMIKETGKTKSILKNTEKLSVLDLGCGDGRDMQRFIELGLKTYGADNDIESLDKAISNCMNEHNVPIFYVGDMMEINQHNKYHGIWACASLLHLKFEELPLMFRKVWGALKINGIFYFSFKEGRGKITDEDGRHFTFMTRQELEDLTGIIGFEILEFWENKDYRDNDKVTNWLNFVVKKM